jgi:hypothetical protein
MIESRTQSEPAAVAIAADVLSRNSQDPALQMPRFRDPG